MRHPGTILQQLLNNQTLSPLSYFFARFIARQAGESEDGVLALTAALLSERNQQGDTCLDLAQFAAQDYFLQNAAAKGLATVNVPAAPPLQNWLQILQSSVCTGKPGHQAPLILDGEKLYLTRFWRYEDAIAQALQIRNTNVTDLDIGVLQAGLIRLFPQQESGVVDWQKLASIVAVTRRYAVISGGPGTGKTTTVIKVLALLLEQQPDLQIRLAAPTGKAAARMVESIRSRKASIALSEATAALIPEQASTLHRLLSYDGRRFRHNRDNPLHADCLVIDEASMIDMTLMASVLDAMPAHCRLILLGDRDQLASVEAGNVLGDITGHGQDIVYSTKQATWLASLAGIDASSLPQSASAVAPAEAVALLRTSFRFQQDSGIGRLARLVNTGQGTEALALLQQPAAPLGSALAGELQWIDGENEKVNMATVDWAVDRYAQYLACDEVAEALRVFNQTRVLCALHQSDLGAVEFNRRIAERLVNRGLLPLAELSHGTPVMVSVNDYELQLFNGDIGLIWRDEQGSLRVWFTQVNGEVSSIPLNNLPKHTLAWAMTVHKSQGSEFDEVLLVLPQDERSPVLSRELIYTGITRARQKVIVHGRELAFVTGCNKNVQRSSGLAQRLGWL